MKSFSIHLLLRHTSGPVLPKRNVQIWLEKAAEDQQLGEALTDADGACTVTFSLPESEFKKNPPFCYVLVYERGRLVYGEKDKPQYKLAEAEMTIRLTLQHELPRRAVDTVPIRRELLRVRPNDSEALGTAGQQFVAEKLNAGLAAALRRYLLHLDPRLKDVLPALAFDYRDWAEKTVGELYRDAVLPLLQGDPATQKLLADNAVVSGLARNDQPIKDLLHLEQPLVKNPLFHAEARILHTAQLVTALGLDEEWTDRLLDLAVDWSHATASQWAGLEKDDSTHSEQIRILRRGFTFSRFTGGQTALAARLQRDLGEAREMAILDRAGWLDLIREAGNETPNGESPDVYADKLLRLAERNFPSDFFLERKAHRPLGEQDALLDELRDLQPAPRRGARSKTGDAPAVSARLSLDESPRLLALANTYRHLGIGKVLGDPNISPEAKLETVSAKQGHLNKFLDNNPGLDLLDANFFKTNQADGPVYRHSYAGIPASEQAGVRRQMMAFQRTLRLTGGNYAHTEALLETGYDSAAALVRTPSATVSEQLGPRFGASDMDILFSQAQQVYNTSVHATASAHGISSDQYFGITVSNIDPALKNELQNIDGYDVLFGNQDYCECDHCKSIFGPAAYFVDLMDFVQEEITRPVFTDNPTHPIALKFRRPDLWLLELTCENINRPVPYLQIINRVLETYTAQILPGDQPKVWEEFSRMGTDGGSLGAGVMVDADSGLGFAARQSRGAGAPGITYKYSFRLPFNRPFEEGQILLEHLGIRYADILAGLRTNRADFRWEQAWLGVSDEEWLALSTPDPNLQELRDMRFSFPPEDSVDPKNPLVKFKLKKIPIRAFLLSTGLSHEEAVLFLSLPSLQQQRPGAIKLTRYAIQDDIQRFNEYVEGLDKAEVLDFIHRFLRLWRILPWSMRELDLAIRRLAPAVGLSPAMLADLATWREVQRRFDLGFEDLLALVDELPVEQLYTRTIANEFTGSSVEVPVPGLRDRLFDPALIPLDGTLLHEDGLSEFEKLSWLLKGLGTTESDFHRVYNMLFGQNDVALNATNVSLFYRHIRLASLLGLSVEEYEYLLRLDGNSLDIPPSRILTTEELGRKMATWPLSLSGMWLIATGTDTTSVKTAYAGLDEAGDPMALSQAKLITQAFFEDKRLAEAAGVPEQQLIFREHLALHFKTDEPLIAQMALWQPGLYGAAWSEALANMALPAASRSSAALAALLPELERVNLLLSKLGLDSDDAALILEKSDQFLLGAGANLLSRITNANDFERLAAYVRLKKNHLDTTQLSAYRDLLRNTTKDKWYDPNQYLDTLARTLGCEPGQVSAIGKLQPFMASNTTLLQSYWPAQLPAQTPEALLALEAGMSVLSRLNLYDKTVLDQLPVSVFSGASVWNGGLHTAFRSRYPTEEAYEKAYEPYENRINELCRDVLCAFLLAIDQQTNFYDTGDLYAYFLVDVEMGGCARVSEILAATLSLQLYIHRVLMGLEVSTVSTGSVRVEMSDAAKKEWEWRRNYRVWEANRKVFLYPENWIEPEWRDDKSPLFRTLEDGLLQQKISLEAAEAAYLQYLKGFAEVGQLVIAGVYCEPGEDGPLYHIFGRTGTDPFQYYYRTMRVLGLPAENRDANTANDRAWEAKKDWTAWEKVELAIESPYVTPWIWRNKLYLFWTLAIVQDSGSSFKTNIGLKYSCVTENGKWKQPQTVRNFYKDKYAASDDYLDDFYRSYVVDRVSLYEKDNQLFADYIKRTDYAYMGTFHIDLFLNQATEVADDFLDNGESKRISWDTSDWMWYDNMLHLGIPGGDTNDTAPGIYSLRPATLYTIGQHAKHPTANMENLIRGDIDPEFALSVSFPVTPHGVDLRIVINNPNDHVFRYENRSYLIRFTEYKEDLPIWMENSGQTFLGKLHSDREMIRLTTSVVDDLLLALGEEGLEGFLTVGNQRRSEAQESIYFLRFDLLRYPFTEIPLLPQRLDFQGAHGLYFRELFFHIPFLIADHLNAEGKYADADLWYRKIFNPSAAFETGLSSPADRYWQYLEFRELGKLRLIDILTDQATIDTYERDPFNPDAIARLRLSAYQKSILMKYVDNLLDWADSLFTRFTWESNTEALMLYLLVRDLLGDRPQNLGKCEAAIGEENCGCDTAVTYQKIKEYEQNHAGDPDLSDFVHYVENWIDTPLEPVVIDGVLTGVEHEIFTGDPVVTDYEDVFGASSQQGTEGLASRGLETSATSGGAHGPGGFIGSMGHSLFHRSEKALVFCIPHNEKMLAYWDLLESRLFNLRHCRDINGVQRSLALFAPPIDPGLLVAARAAGLSLDEVLATLDAAPPPYRFSFLLEKARAYAGTVQGFGGALLSALEKKDTEELTLLRSMHEQNLLKMTREVKQQAIEEARANLQSALESMVNVVNRQLHYTGLIETGLTTWEVAQQSLKTAANLLMITDGVLKAGVGFAYLVPNIGSLTAMTYGGKQIGDAGNLAAQAITSSAAVFDIMASMAAQEASNQRREQEWALQEKLAKQEIKQVQQQIASAAIRLGIAEKDLAIHDKQVEQAAEVHEFYKNKFTGLGLYNDLANTLGRLNRLAYNAALDLAKRAESAYRFETDDPQFLGRLGNWDAGRAGLLAGEHLALQLNQMEAAYLGQHTRRLEIRQTFSLRLLDPVALVSLRTTGNCTFKIPEWAIDLQYPGQYRRRLMSVQLTIPCVTGPYVNVAATLTMLSGSLKKDAFGTTQGFDFNGCATVATSSANNDGGQFELNFRDERYLPFEGAGAVDSEWNLELPGAYRTFDYNTISDVIVHLSYQAMGGGVKPTPAEIKTAAGTLKRFISLKEEFPEAWYQLGLNQPATITLSKKHFPFFAQASVVEITSVSVLDSSSTSAPVIANSWQITILPAHKNTTGDDVWLLIPYTL